MALWAIVSVYCAISLLNGATGLGAYRELLSGKEIQLDNIRKLGAINNELENTQNSLLYDRDTIAVHARQQGFGYENEHFMRIVGLGEIKNPYKTAGDVITLPEPVFVQDRIIKIWALFAGIVVFAIMLTFEFLRR